VGRSSAGQTMAKSADVDSCRWGLQSRLLHHLPSLIYDVQDVEDIVNGLLNVPAVIAMQRSGWPEVVLVIVRSPWELDFRHTAKPSRLFYRASRLSIAIETGQIPDILTAVLQKLAPACACRWLCINRHLNATGPLQETLHISVTMNRFTADYSSSLPSTPDAQTPSRDRLLFTDMSNQFSTTPAGLPPSSAASFTPADPPPAATFGDSPFGSGVSKLKFTKSPNKQAQAFRTSTRPSPSSVFPPGTKNGTRVKLHHANRSMAPNDGLFPQRQPFQHSRGPTSLSDEEDNEDKDDYEDEDKDGHNQYEAMDVSQEASTRAFRGLTSIDADPAGRPAQSSMFQRSTQSARNLRLQTSMRKLNHAPKRSRLPRRGKDSVVPNIARDLASRSGVASLHEPDQMILQTEDLVLSLGAGLETSSTIEGADALISACTNDLLRLWRSHAGKISAKHDSTGIGPGDSATSLEKAYFLTSLLLPLHHPPSQPTQSTSNLRFSTSRSTSLVSPSPSNPVPIPQVLIEWLDKHHATYKDLLQSVRSASPNCTSHDMFWDTVQILVLRGKLQDVIQLLAAADFKYAVTALDDDDDGEEGPGYTGARLQSVQGIIYRARQVLDGCPGLRQGDWHVDGSDWDLYRKRVSNELEHLTQLYEGHANSEEEDGFQAENFGIQKGAHSLLRSTHRRQSTLPEAIYHSLSVMYSILLGSAIEIIAQSMDWLDASAALTIWWDGDGDDAISAWSMNVSRSQRPDQPTVRENPYLSRLSAAFLCVTDPDDQDSFQINPMSELEVGLASVLQGSVEGVLTTLRAYSLCITCSLAEVATMAGWFPIGNSSQPVGLDQEDLMVLSYGVDPLGIRKNDIVIAYAEALFEREELHGDDGTVIEGWEMAMTLACRITDDELAHRTASHFLDQIPMTSQERMEKLFTLCSDLAFEEEARKICERYADHLVNDTVDYGTALLFYARSHAAPKVRLVVDLLVSFCLVQSAAYPPPSELDENLRSLVESPKKALSDLVKTDPEAAEMLSFYLSGYACLRKFYNLRDEDILAKLEGRKPNRRPIARKREAARALTAVINSAADCIYGGLYDPDRQSAIQVDGILTLLGEATEFGACHSEQKPIFTSDQLYALLAAIEDLQTVNSRVYDAAEECLQAALRNWHGSAPPSPHAMLKKSVSSGTNSNFSFSMMGSEMMARSEEDGQSTGGKSVGGSGVLVAGGKKRDITRGWDWRAKFKGKESTGRDVLKTLRMGIARELSVAELG
jgi:hypothetical protein